jgi:pyridoxal 5'-phosphate synthase pdxT subunit
VAVIGVLALQGNFGQHHALLSSQNVCSRFVKTPDDLKGLSGLIIPGGESSALLTLMAPFNFLQHIRHFYDGGGAIFGTCAGLILLAKQVSPVQNSLGLLDVEVQRNAYGRQRESFVAEGSLVFSDKTIAMPMVFIRAPKILAVSPDVRIIGRYQQDITCVHQGRLLGATFHPEMSQNAYLHHYFVDHVCQQDVVEQ